MKFRVGSHAGYVH